MKEEKDQTEKKEGKEADKTMSKTITIPDKLYDHIEWLTKDPAGHHKSVDEFVTYHLGAEVHMQRSDLSIDEINFEEEQKNKDTKNKAVKEAGEKTKNQLGHDVDIREIPMTILEIDLPEDVLMTLNVSIGDKLRFVEENGRVYIEKA